MKNQSTPPPEVLFSTEGFAASDDLKSRVTQKADKIFRHQHPPIVRVRVHVTREALHGAPVVFRGRALAERQGPDCVAHAAAAEPGPAAAEALDKLERILAGEAGVRKHTKHHPHGVELPSQLPKV